MQWVFILKADGRWRWQQWEGDKLIQESPDAFSHKDNLLDDARKNGFTLTDARTARFEMESSPDDTPAA